MKNMKKLIAVIAAVGVLGTAGAAFAATIKTPAEIAAGLTGKTVEQVYTERATGKTYGTIANDAGKLDEFKAQMLEQRKAILDQRVKDGTLTQEQADQIYNAMKNNQALCTGAGTGFGMMGGRYGAGLGNNAGSRSGYGGGFGRGMMGYGSYAGN